MQLAHVLELLMLVVIVAEVSFVTFKLQQRQVKRLPGGQALLLDTSVLIDGRIISIATAGFLPARLIVLRSVVRELQTLADNGDSEKRSRARHGLDVLSELQNIKSVTVEILDDMDQTAPVDEKLLTMAAKHHAAICTIDYNLNKVAVVENIVVLNINELAKNLRMSYLPGERTHINLSQKGEDADQAVGHLPDGTMVVIENSRSMLGQTVEVEFIRGLQTSAGRMMFAKLVGGRQGANKQQLVRQAASASSNGGQVRQNRHHHPARGNDRSH